MELFNFKGKQNSITKALQLSVPDHAVISITGAGGKTSLLFAWAREFAASGRRTVVTTTTHMLSPAYSESGIDIAKSCIPCAVMPARPDDEGPFDSTLQLIDHMLDEEGLVMVASEDSEDLRKVTAPPDVVMDHLYDTADIVLIEADGSRMMPLKWPAPWEPVVPEQTDITVCVAGLSSLGRKVNEVVYRAEFLPDGWKRDIVDPSLIRAVLASSEGGQKGARGDFRVFLNQTDSDELKKAASDIQMLLAVSGVQSAWGTLL